VEFINREQGRKSEIFKGTREHATPLGKPSTLSKELRVKLKKHVAKKSNRGAILREGKHFVSFFQ